MNEKGETIKDYERIKNIGTNSLKINKIKRKIDFINND